MADLAARILDANKLIRQKETAWTLIDVDTLMKEAVHTLKPQFDSSQAAVSYHGTPATVKGEYASLLNVLTNLMDNAVKYNQHASPALDISTHVAAGQVVINLADNGPGIPPEFRQKIFEPFFRVPQGNRHDVKGYGLGLSYVRQVVESHRGVVTFIANHPHGSIFTIKLPLG